VSWRAARRPWRSKAHRGVRGERLAGLARTAMPLRITVRPSRGCPPAHRSPTTASRWRLSTPSRLGLAVRVVSASSSPGSGSASSRMGRCARRLRLSRLRSGLARDLNGDRHRPRDRRDRRRRHRECRGRGLPRLPLALRHDHHAPKVFHDPTTSAATVRDGAAAGLTGAPPYIQSGGAVSNPATRAPGNGHRRRDVRVDVRASRWRAAVREGLHAALSGLFTNNPSQTRTSCA